MSDRWQKLLATLSGAANKLISTRFQYTPRIEAAPVVHKNVRVCSVDKLSGFSMQIFKVVMEYGVHVFIIHEKAELPGVSNAEIEELLATVRAPSRLERRRLAAHGLLWRLLSPWSGPVRSASVAANRPSALGEGLFPGFCGLAPLTIVLLLSRISLLVWLAVSSRP